ncbi:prepilin-type N-terminal cleavage/methylation domain-containing protein [Patescibacteria group bacterium]|nr:prepilin-type N-terminal cleavage/methylation domain-containing protein [Patescibacteria group bacterium]MBU1952790.1 prepilin-type N-terminal cleavage/methylation domain-containing protein [Patescibacteria group bacterium]
MKRKKETIQEGFTLIELMLVVLIIGVLSGLMLGVINIPGIQSKSRDARRIGELKRIQTALELYFADFRGYPSKTAWQDLSVAGNSVSSAISPIYINKVPEDPKKGSNASAGVSCFNGKTAYGYYYITNSCVGSGCLSGKYVLGAIMEVSGSATNYLCSNLGNCTGATPAITCACGGAYCYGVENPL